MKNKFLLLTIFLALCAMLATSCTKDGGDDNGGGGDNGGGNVKITHLDIVGAEYLYTTGTGGTTRADDDGTSVEQIFKIMFDGTTQEVVVKNENGTKILIENVAFMSLTDDILLFAFSPIGTGEDGMPSQRQDRADTFYFVRKSDGGVFEVPEMFHSAFFEYGYYPPLYWRITQPKMDKNQNIYAYGDRSTNLYRINLQGDVSATPVVTDAVDFKVDYAGNILYYNDFDNAYFVTPSGKKFRTSDVETVAFNDIVSFPKRESGGFLYRKYDDNQYGGEWNYYLCEVDGDAEKTVLTQIESLNTHGYENMVVLANKIVILPTGLVGGDLPVRAEEESASTITILREDFSIKTISDPRIGINLVGVRTAAHVYWRDDTAIYDFNAETEEITTLYTLQPAAEYSNFSFADDLIIFLMTDRNREKRYWCEIKNGVYSEKEMGTSETQAPKIINFVRVN